MKYTVKHHRLKTAAALAVACILLVGTATAVYAADVGGIQRMIQLWINGEQTTATLQLSEDGTYHLEYPDESGSIQEQSGGGVAFDPDGGERPLTEEELLEHLSMPEVEYREDGSVWVYWFDQSLEITDKFENGACYVKLENGRDTLYMTVEYGNGYTTSPHRYIIP